MKECNKRFIHKKYSAINLENGFKYMPLMKCEK